MMDVLSFKQQMDAGSMAREEGKLAAEMEDVAAMQRETDRKLALASAIGTARAGAAGAGIAINTGSPLTAMNEMVRQSNVDTERDQFNSRVAALTARYRGAAQAGQIRGQAGIGLLRAVEQKATTVATGGIK